MDISYDQSAQQPTVPPASHFKFQRGRATFVAIATVILCLALFSLGYYFLVYQKDLANTTDIEASVFVPEEDEIEYKNAKYGFKMIVKRDWNVNEFGSKVEFKTLNNGQIIFEAFNNSEFASISEVNERFCESFEKGFQEGISDAEIAKQFNFVLLEQNGIKGCEAEGEILGFKQKYNVYYNPFNSNVYTLLYTSTDPASEEELIEAASSFTLTTE